MTTISSELLQLPIVCPGHCDHKLSEMKLLIAQIFQIDNIDQYAYYTLQLYIESCSENSWLKQKTKICSIMGTIANCQDVKITQESKLLASPLTTRLSPST